MTEYISLAELTSDEPIAEKPKDAATCPSCRGESLTHHGSARTLVAGSSPEDTFNINHYTHDLRCNACNLRFTREHKDGNVWYADGKTARLLRGVPSCFESYGYNCRKCGGEVEREYRKMDGFTKTATLGSRAKEGGGWERDYRTFFFCKGCGAGGEAGV